MSFKKINEKIALWGTQAFGSMWAFYLFFTWGLLGMLPWVPSNFKTVVLLISSAWIQLWALPLLAVGNVVSNRASEKRAKQDHEMIKAQFEMMKKDLLTDQEEFTKAAVFREKILEQLELLNEKIDNKK